MPTDLEAERTLVCMVMLLPFSALEQRARSCLKGTLMHIFTRSLGIPLIELEIYKVELRSLYHREKASSMYARYTNAIIKINVSGMQLCLFRS